MKSNVNLTKIKAASCAKCHESGSLLRHHKGFDSFLGQFDEKISNDYSLYKDCVLICDVCHAIIHTIYDFEINYNSDKLLTKTGVWKLRQRYIACCNEWLSSSRYDVRYNKDSKLVQDQLAFWRVKNRKLSKLRS